MLSGELGYFISKIYSLKQSSEELKRAPRAGFSSQQAGGAKQLRQFAVFEVAQVELRREKEFAEARVQLLAIAIPAPQAVQLKAPKEPTTPCS